MRKPGEGDGEDSILILLASSPKPVTSTLGKVFMYIR